MPPLHPVIYCIWWCSCQTTAGLDDDTHCSRANIGCVLQAALKNLLCGDSERLDVPRLRMLLEAFSAYTMDARSEASPGAMQRRGRSSSGIWGEAVVDRARSKF